MGLPCSLKRKANTAVLAIQPRRDGPMSELLGSDPLRPRWSDLGITVFDMQFDAALVRIRNHLVHGSRTEVLARVAVLEGTRGGAELGVRDMQMGHLIRFVGGSTEAHEVLLAEGEHVVELELLLLALLLLYAFAFTTGLFPMSGAYNSGIPKEFSWPFISSVAYHAVLPALSIILTSLLY